MLNHGQRTLDLRGTSIRKLMLDMTGLEELWLCEGTELLLFQNKGPDACAIHAPEDGSGLTSNLSGNTARTRNCRTYGGCMASS